MPVAMKTPGRGGLGWMAFTATSGPARAFMAYVTNERDNTMSVVDLDQMKTVKTVPVGQRPRGITMTADVTRSWSARATTTRSRSSTRRPCTSSAICRRVQIPKPSPCTSPAIRSLCRMRRHWYGDRHAHAQGDRAIPTGVEPRAWQVSRGRPDDRDTSETTNMAHSSTTDAQDGGEAAG